MATVAEAKSRLGDAAEAARNCGCDTLVNQIEAVNDRVGFEETCQSQADAVLGATTALERLAEACH